MSGWTALSVSMVKPANAVLPHLAQLLLSVYEIMGHLRKLMKAMDSLLKKSIYT